MKHSIALLITLLAIGLSSCSTSGSNDADLAGYSATIELSVHELEHENNEDVLRFFQNAYQRDLVIARCMKQEGFDHEPELPPTLLISDDVARGRFQRAGAMDPLSREYREEFGFGVSTLSSLLQVVGSSTSGQYSTDKVEQEQYERALYGDEFIDASLDGTLQLETAPGGCAGLSEQEVPFSYTTPDEEYATFNDIYDETRDRVRADIRYNEAQDLWVECIRKLGYPYTSREDIVSSFDRELDSINVFLRDGGESEFIIAGQELSDEALEESELKVEQERANSSVYDEEDLHLVQQREIRAALEIRPCDVEFVESTADLVDEVADVVMIENGTKLAGS